MLTSYVYSPLLRPLGQHLSSKNGSHHNPPDHSGSSFKLTEIVQLTLGQLICGIVKNSFMAKRKKDDDQDELSERMPAM